MFLNVRLIGLIEEDLRKIRKRLVHHIMVLEHFSKVSGRSKVPQRRNLRLQRWFASGYQINIAKTTAFWLTISETLPFLWTPERSCLGIPVRWDKHILQADPSIHLLIHQTPIPESSHVFVDHLISSPRCSARVSLEIKRPTDIASKNLLFEAIANTESGVMGGPVRVCNSVWTKIVSLTVRGTLVFLYKSFR